MTSASSFVPDLKLPSAYRIPRKPPPAIDVSERYPSPDPADPFAPLWILRKRTSSLQGSRIHTPLPQVSGLYGSEETLNNPIERSPSDSCFSSPRNDAHAYNKTKVTSPSASGDNSSVASPPGSSSGPNPRSGAKIGHYTPHSRLNTVGTLQAFPRIPTPQASQTHVDLGSPEPKRRPSLLNSDHALQSQSVNDPDLTDSSKLESDDGAIFDSSSGVKVSNIAHLHLKRPSNSQSKQDLPVSRSTPTTDTATSHNRLAKIFFPRKINSLISSGRGRVTSSPTANTTPGRRSSANGFRQVSKSSISAPQPVQSTVIRDPKNSLHRRRRDSTLITRPTAEVYLDDGQRTSHFLGPAIEKSISLDARQEELLVKGANHRQKHNRRHFGVPTGLFSIRKSTDLEGRDHHCISEQRLASDIGSNTLDIKKSRRPVLRSLTNPLPISFKLKEGDGIKARNRSRMLSSPPPPPLSPIQPSMRSVSSSSIVDISLSAPSFASNPSVFTKPRPAPHPLGTVANGQPSASPKGDTRHKHNASECCSSDGESGPAPSISAFPIPPVPSSTPIPIPAEWGLPTVQQLAHAAYLPVTCEDGSQVSFGSLFEKTRTIVVFIRHFWCPLCQDYMSSLKSIVKPEMLSVWPVEGEDDAGDLKSRLVSFVVIGNGAHGMIHKYRQIFGLPFKVHTDPSLAIYQALGMGRDWHYYAQQKGPSVDLLSSTPADGNKIATGCGRVAGYVKHGLMGGIAMVVGRAIKVGMPVWENGGDVDQLGGEFIFGPGLKCSFAHRMQSAKGHAPIEDVLTAAGIDINAALTTPRQGDLEYTRASLDLASDNIALSIQPTGLQDLHPPTRTSSLRAHRQFDKSYDLTSRRHTKSFSTGMFTGVLSREEEDKWMEQREQNIERLRERKNVRRMGLIGLRPSTTELHPPPASDVFKPGKEEELEQGKIDPGPDESYWEPLSDVEDSGDLADAEESMDAPTNWSASQQVWAAWRNSKSFKSTADSASIYSLPSAIDVPIRFSVKRATHIFMDTEEA